MAEGAQVRRIYDRMARSYDATTGRAFLERMRAGLFGRARGHVLELGVGTGATFAAYPPTLASLTALDISTGMLDRARQRAHGLPYPVAFQVHDFQTLPFAGAHFDTVVSSLALCGIPDPAALFAEIRRVLRPGGQLLALEHIRPPHPVLGRLADVASPINNHVIGCYLNRRTPDLLRAAGFRVTVVGRAWCGAFVALVATPRA